jgi:two-component system response regulator FlrC
VKELLFISASASVENAVRAMKTGALDFLVKPVEPDQIRLYVQKAFSLPGDEETGTGTFPEASSGRHTIVTQDKRMFRLLNLAEQVADSQASVLIQGGSGTGKELFARYIHQQSNRCDGPFVAVNCAALPETLLESELFGYEKGAFTGALSKKPGKFELASNGTILLDEITEMQLHLQAKLLRVIQEHEVDRIGGLKPVAVNVRVIATTNRDILDTIQKGDFREDLYYRLNIIPLKIPPLRERGADKALLAEHFIKKYNAIDGRDVKGLTDNALDYLDHLPLKGNVRELENIIRRAVLLSRGEWLEAEDLSFEDVLEHTSEKCPEPSSSGKVTDIQKDFMTGSLKEIEQRAIMHTLNQTDGNRTHAANVLGISVRTLRNKLNEYKKMKTIP